jgi:hypothetical protein
MPSIINATTTNGVAVSGDNSGSLALQTNNGTTAVTIDTSQNVLVGTTTSQGKVTTKTADVGSGSTDFATKAFSSEINFSATNKIGSLVAGYDGSIFGTAIGYSYNGAGYNMQFATNDDITGNPIERMRITSSGLALFGSTSATFSMPTTGGASFKASNTGGGSPIVEIGNTDTTSGSDGSPALLCFKGSSTTSSSARFIQFSASGATQPMGAIVGNGATNAQFASVSDAREKTNIQPINGSLAKINALKPVQFNWISDGTYVPAGFVAQDVQQVFPEFVVDNMAEEGQEQRYGLTGGMTGGIVAHLVAAIQELKAELDATKAEVQALKGA